MSVTFGALLRRLEKPRISVMKVVPVNRTVLARLAPIWLVLLFLPAGRLAGESLDDLLRRRGEAFVAATNAPGDSALVAFARDHLGTDVAREGRTGRIVEVMRRDWPQLGPIDAHRLQVVGEGAALFVFCRRANTGAWQNYQFRVLAQDGHRLQLVFVAVAVEPMPRPTTPIADPASRDWLATYLRHVEQQHPFGGVIAVRHRNQEVFGVAQGMADDARKTPISRSSRLNMASGSKMFTAVAILQLAQAGKLSVDDPLLSHLPDFPDRDFAARTTLHQLLTHTAGAGNYWDDAYEAAWDTITTLPQMLPHVLRHLGETPAGEFSYANSGYVLLGLVIEAASGETYYDYVQRHIFAPAGMVATGFPLRGEETPDVARPYDPRLAAGAVQPGAYIPAVLGARGTSAGGAVTTADDMFRFADALQGAVLLDRAHLALMTADHVPYSATDSWYGYGVIIEKKRGVLSYGHGGMAPGTQFEFKVYPDVDAVMVMLSNFDTIAGPEMATAIDDVVRNAGNRRN